MGATQRTPSVSYPAGELSRPQPHSPNPSLRLLDCNPNGNQPVYHGPIEGLTASPQLRLDSPWWMVLAFSLWVVRQKAPSARRKTSPGSQTLVRTPHYNCRFSLPRGLSRSISFDFLVRRKRYPPLDVCTNLDTKIWHPTSKLHLVKLSPVV